MKRSVKIAFRSRASLRCGAFAVAALALAGQPVAAQQREAAPDRGREAAPEIVVTGDRAVQRRVRSFVAALAPAPASGQLARFETPVCPIALGLGAGERAAVERRLRAVAAAAGMAVAPPGCAASALLVVVDDKSRFVEALRLRHRRFLGSLGPGEIRRLAEGPGPAAAWQQIESVTARGLPVNGAQSSPGRIESQNFSIEPPSRIVAAVRPVIQASALVVERHALRGLTATQLADYAAMRLFARTEPSRLDGSAAPTIVTILEAPMGSAVPLTLTAWDLGFLRGLYASPPNVYSGVQRAAMAREIARQLEGAAAAD